MANPHARFQPWKVYVKGVLKTISVLASDVPDSLNGLSGKFGDVFDMGKSYAKGVIVLVTAPISGSQTGVYGCVQNVSGVAPQFPNEVAQWHFLCYLPNQINTCGQGSVFIQSSTPT